MTTTTTETTAPSLAELKAIVAACDFDIQALAGGSKASAAQARKKLSMISKMCAELRRDCLAYQKSLPTRSRARTIKAPEPEPEPEPTEPEPLIETPPPKAPRKRASRKSKAAKAAAV